MLKNLSELEGVKLLSKKAQKQTNGGFGGGGWPICDYFCDNPTPSVPCICLFP
ncbi:hypothetical protein [Kordia sp.]|uniref:hypothetical protein n=1 Tax=Kordia sp. TaxID=1965332 RepID=UPI003D6ACAF3